MRRVVPWIMLFASAIASPARAQGELPRIRLVYDAPSSCPDGSGFRDLVAARLGYDAFDDASSTVLHLEIARAARGFTARASLRGARGARRLGPFASCAELATTAAVTLSILLDPLASPHERAPITVPTPEASAVAPPSTPPSAAPAAAPSEPPLSPHPEPPLAPELTPPAPALPAAELATPAPEPAAPTMAVVPRLALDVGAALGFAPAASLEADVEVGLGLGALFHVALAGRLRHTLLAVDVNGQNARVATYGGALVGCLRVSILVGCLDVEVGAHIADASSLPSSRQSLHASSGVRIGIEVPVAPGIALRALVGAAVPWLRLRLILDERPAWEAAPITGVLVVGLALTTP